MDFLWKTALWQQFGATIGMLENALLACPDTHWHGRLWRDSSEQPLSPEFAEFWFITYHTLFWLDLYLSGLPEEDFTPPAPFTWVELDPTWVLPERPYSREQLHTYLIHLRQKCQTTIAELSEEKAQQQVEYAWGEGKSVSYLELLLYTMRHVQEHAAQLNLFLGQNGIDGVSDWVPQAQTVEGP